METAANVSPNKSTTVRTKIQTRVQEAGLRYGMATLSAVAPALAARTAQRMFLTPRHFTRPAWEAEALRTAVRGTLPTPYGTLPTYSWGSGPTVLLVHGWEGRGSQMSAFVPALLAAGYRALAIDLPGHGEAAHSESSAFDFARALNAVLPQLPDLHGVIAHSMGAAASALANVFAPYEARLVLIAPPRGPRGFFDMFTRYLGLGPRSLAHAEQNMKRRFGMTIDDIDIARTGAGISLQTLVVHDRGDKEVPFAHGQLYASTLPNARMHATDGLGHRRVLRDQAVIGAVLGFLLDRSEDDTRAATETASSAMQHAQMSVSVAAADV